MCSRTERFAEVTGVNETGPVALVGWKGKQFRWINRRALSLSQSLLLFSFGCFPFICLGKSFHFPFCLWIRSASPLVLDQNYINTKNQVIKAERRILKELGFCVHVKHPHKVSKRPHSHRQAGQYGWKLSYLVEWCKVFACHNSLLEENFSVNLEPSSPTQCSVH